MTKRQSQNPYTTEPAEVANVLPQQFQRGRVLDVGNSDEGNFHYATVKLYQSGGQETFPVLSPAYGDVAIPTEGSDVIVLFNDNESGIVIGQWYAADRIVNGNREIPDFVAGDRVIGNDTDSIVKIHNDGAITISTEGSKPVDIDVQSALVDLTQDQTIPNEGVYTKIQFDSAEEGDVNNLFDPTTHDITVNYGGLYHIYGSVEIESAGQNNLYDIAIFLNDSIIKRRSVQSTVNNRMSLEVRTDKRLEPNDTVDIRVQNNSGKDRIVAGNPTTAEFSINRTGRVN